MPGLSAIIHSQQPGQRYCDYCDFYFFLMFLKMDLEASELFIAGWNLLKIWFGLADRHFQWVSQ